MSKLSLQQRREANILVINQSLPPTNPHLYVIDRRSYSRSNTDERHYRAKWWPTLMRTYDCRCGLCGEDRDGIELDHFWIPKSHGGCFTMRLAGSPKTVNNAVPLCTACNRKKQDSVIELSDSQTSSIAEKNRRMNATINDDSVVESSAKLSGFIPGDERRALGLDNYIGEMARMYKAKPTPELLEIIKEDVDRYLLVRA